MKEVFSVAACQTITVPAGGDSTGKQLALKAEEDITVIGVMGTIKFPPTYLTKGVLHGDCGIGPDGFFADGKLGGLFVMDFNSWRNKSVGHNNPVAVVMFPTGYGFPVKKGETLLNFIHAYSNSPAVARITFDSLIYYVQRSRRNTIIS